MTENLQPQHKPNAAPQNTPRKAAPQPLAVGKPRTWRERFTLSRYLTTIVFLAILTASCIAGFYAFNVQYLRALKDTWAILFLEAEKHGNMLATMVGYYPVLPTKSAKDSGEQLKNPDFVLKIKTIDMAESIYKDSPVRRMVAKDFNRKEIGFPDENNVLLLRTGLYVLKKLPASRLNSSLKSKIPEGNYLVGWKIDFNRWFVQQRLYSNPFAVSYITNKDGVLIHASHPQITAENVVKRPLVQKFTTSKFALGEFEFKDEKGESFYGMFYELPTTNLIMFSEISKRQALSSVVESAKNFGFVLVVIIIFSIMLIRIPLGYVTKPLIELAELAREVGRGNYQIKQRHNGLGEINALTTTFTVMAKSLVARDHAIRSLMKEQEVKIRMEHELSLAKSLQDNFIPRAKASPKAGLQIEALYVPASQVAGDWFTYDYNEVSGETLVVLADVSGHDIASSMFTAIIAGIFYEVRESFPEQFPILEFTQKLNRRFLHFGRGKWHATLMVLRHKRGSSNVEIVNCGQTFPVLIKPGSPQSKASIIRMPSDPVGLATEFTHKSTQFELIPGETILFYTDGITETKNKDGCQYGSKRLIKNCEKMGRVALHEFSRSILREVEDFRANTQAMDDQCVISIRINDAKEIV